MTRKPKRSATRIKRKFHTKTDLIDEAGSQQTTSANSSLPTPATTAITYDCTTINIQTTTNPPQHRHARKKKKNKTRPHNTHAHTQHIHTHISEYPLGLRRSHRNLICSYQLKSLTRSPQPPNKTKQHQLASAPKTHAERITCTHQHNRRYEAYGLPRLNSTAVINKGEKDRI